MEEIADIARSLVRLDRLDLERWQAQQELARTPLELAASEEALGVSRTALAASTAELARVQAAVRDSERELSDVEAKAKRADKRLTMVFTSTQIDATKRELATLAERRDELEETILEAMERAEGLEEEVAEGTLALAAGEAGFAEQVSAWASRSSQLEARVEELTAERDPLFAGLRSDVSRRYQVGWKFGRFKPPSGLTNAAMDGVCRTCHASLSFKWLSESRRHAALHACDICKRIIVFDPDAPPPAPVAATEDPADS